MTSESMLEARAVAVRYRPPRGPLHEVLDDFSLGLAPGQIVAILGPSGAGKSSLLRVLAGLQRPDQGQVSMGGQPLKGPHPRIGFLFQDPCLLPWLSLEENVGFGLDFKHQPAITRVAKRRRVAAAIAEVGLEDACGRYPNALSGGMAQRAALARTLTRQPEVLLLDEPFSALDEITRGDMQTLLLTVAAHHRTAAVLVTHDIDEALVLADQIVLIGGQPARQVGAWPIGLPHPRDDAAAELVRIRIDIVRRMRQAHTGIARARRLAA